MVTVAQAQGAPASAPKTTNGAPKAEAKAAAPKKGKKAKAGKVDRLNARVLYAAGLAAKIADEMLGQVERLDDGKPVRKLVESVAAHAAAARKTLEDASADLFRLKDARWEPRGGARPFRAGDFVNLKARHVERYTKNGAYAAADLRGMKVLSVHGEAAKVATPKGESLGLVALFRLSVADK
jgi:hypothetical protein